jgi:hypothetical protein
MGNGEYAFFGVELVKSTGSYGDFSWYQPGDKRNKQAREMYEALMMVAVRVPTSPEYTTFTHKVTQMSLDEFGGTTAIENVSKPFFLNSTKSQKKVINLYIICYKSLKYNEFKVSL